MSTPPLARTSLFSSMMRCEENLAYAKAQAARSGHSRIGKLACADSPVCPRLCTKGSNPRSFRAVRSRACSPNDGYSGHNPCSQPSERGREYRLEPYLGSEVPAMLTRAAFVRHEADELLSSHIVPPDGPGGCHQTTILSEQFLVHVESQDIIEDFHQLEPVEVFLIAYDGDRSAAFLCIKARYGNNMCQALSALNLWVRSGGDEAGRPLPEGFTEVLPFSKEMQSEVMQYISGIPFKYYDRDLARAVLASPASLPDSRPFCRYITLAMLEGAIANICTGRSAGAVQTVFSDFCVYVQPGESAYKGEALSTWEAYIGHIKAGQPDQAEALLPVLRGYFSVLSADVDNKITRECMDSLNTMFLPLMREQQLAQSKTAASGEPTGP